MKKVLFTGKSGFIGKNVLAELEDFFEIHAPSRKQLDLRDASAVEKYIKKGSFDVVFHSANPNPVKNILDRKDNMFEDSMRIFLNLYGNKKYCEKFIFIGSGAEYGKQNDLIKVKEVDFSRVVPSDTYGFSKFLMSAISQNSRNVHNMRLFACFGPYDHASKFITHAINCCMKNEPVTIRQNCNFDYIHVSDMVYIIKWMIEGQQKHFDYNISSGKTYSLEEIAKIVIELMGSKSQIEILNSGMNNEYTADNTRLLDEMGTFEFLPIREGIQRQIKWQKEGIK